MKTTRTILTLTVVTILAGPALADWDPGDGHKMHFPQLPDPNGWDVAFVSWVAIPPPQMVELADDWQCSGTGPVEDIHFWYSWRMDAVHEIDWIHARIYSNNPAGGQGHSEPNELLWQRQFLPGEFAIGLPGTGLQGWYDPVVPFTLPDDHSLYFPMNIEDIANPFTQEEGTIYWLGIEFKSWADGQPGWKTSLDHWNDNAVYRVLGAAGPWNELGDPLDLAFVITPEPASAGLLLAGLPWVFRRRRKPQTCLPLAGRQVRCGGRR